MGPALKLNIQVDRLPNVGPEASPTVQLGVRLSAMLVHDAAVPTTVELRDLVLPWKWQSTALKDPGTWDPHDKVTWDVWRLIAGNPAPVQVAAASIKDNVLPSITFDTLDDIKDGKPVPRFRNQVEEQIRKIIEDLGPSTLEEPSNTTITGRTVYGLVESLTSLPHPVPYGMKVWSAITIDPTGFMPALDDGDRFLAIPRFAIEKADYKPPSVTDADWTKPVEVDLVPTPADGVEARAVKARVQPSPAIRDLDIKADEPAKLINVSKLQIRAGGRPFESSDWSATLAGRIAEAIDPAAQFMAVLDETIRARAVKGEDPAKLDAQRAALAEDLRQEKDFFGTILTQLHRPVLTPRARRSRVTAAPATSLLEGMALQHVALWPATLALLLSHAGGEDDANPPEADYRAVSRARLAAAAGVVPTPPAAPDTKPPGANEPEAVDTEDAFHRWVVRHWVEAPLPTLPSPLGPLAFQGSASELVYDTTTKKIGPSKTSPRRTGVIDVRRLPPNFEVKITLLLETTTAGAAIAGKVQIVSDAGSEVAALTFQGQSAAVTTAAAAKRTASLALSLKRDGAAVSVSVTGPNGTEGPATDISAAAAAGRLGVIVALTSGDLESVKIDASSLPIEPLRIALVKKARGLRAALSLAHAGPVLDLLMRGWVADATPDGDLTKLPLADRLAKTIGAYVGSENGGAFKDALEQARARSKIIAEAIAGAANDQERQRLRDLMELLDKLLQRVLKNACAQALRLAHEIVPANREKNDGELGVTQEALPLVFAVDQLQAFDGEAGNASAVGDLWTRLAGIGVLMRRTGGPNDHDDQWWSLNAATLHVNKPTADDESPLWGEQNAVGTAPGDWPRVAAVDPVPLVVGQINGVRGALIRYESQSLVAEMAHTTRLNKEGFRAVSRRPEAFFFPSTGFVRLPPLTFGREYGIVPYLIGQGGALPLPLRDKSLDPVTLTTNREKDRLRIDPDLLRDQIRTTRYLRTVPVGAPTLSPESVWPLPLPDVATLASELPVRLPSVTLRQSTSQMSTEREDLAAEDTCFFLDKERQRGILDGPVDVSDAVPAGVVIHIGSIALPPKPPSQPLPPIDAVSMWISVWSRDDAGECQRVLSAEVSLATILKQAGAGLRLTVRGSEARIQAVVPGVYAEDQPTLSTSPLWSAVADAKVSLWKSAFIVLSARGADLEVEPPTLQWGMAALIPGELELEGDHPVLPPEVPSRGRDVSVLDGIGVGTKTGPKEAKLVFRRPATSFAVFDRWVNGPLSGFGTMDAGKVRVALKNAYNLATGEPKRSLDDPAVEALFVEVVRIFPKREVIQPPIMLEAFGDDRVLPERHGADLKTALTIRVDKEGFDVAGRVVRVTAGYVYELRIYGAIAMEQPIFATQLSATGGVTALPTMKRFAAAATAGWRMVLTPNAPQGEQWHLGAPLVLAVEVATERMPEISLFGLGKSDDDRNPSFVVQFPPGAPGERATFHLDRRIITLRSEAEDALPLRYVDRIALFEQRWSWRGRPQPQFPSSSTSAFGTDAKIDNDAREFVDASFLGRADDDIGAIREIRISRAHAYGGAPTLGEKAPANQPVVLTKDLDHRGGANLWRFALRAKSRYAAMRPNDPAMVRFSHRRPKRSETAWWPLIVPDGPNVQGRQRKVARPGLLLVLPLTEPMMADGAVPPLLALFNEPMFPLFHAGDGIEAVIEVARHPFPGGDFVGPLSGPLLKYWQEQSPDPVRTKEASSGTPLALRCDGPIGYTFDLETEAGRFDHAGILVSPVLEAVKAWSLIKLRFRRSEIPELLVGADELSCTRAFEPRRRWRLSSADGSTTFNKDASDGRDATAYATIKFATVHEGIAIDVEELPPTTKDSLGEPPLELGVSFDSPAGGDVAIVRAHIEADGSGYRLDVEAATHLGPAGTWSMKYARGAKVQMRLVVSPRPKPDQVDPDFTPVGDVSVRVRVDRGEVVDTLLKPEENTWLSVLCLPLTAHEKEWPSKDLTVVVDGFVPPRTTVRPIRLSDFTPGVWCQFAANMSQVRAEATRPTTGASPSSLLDEDIPVSKLTAVASGKTITLVLGIADLDLQKNDTIRLRAGDAPDDDAQLEEPLFAVVTVYDYDAFDHLRERALAVYQLPEDMVTIGGKPLGLALSGPQWSPEGDKLTFDERSGRIRFLRLLRPRGFGGEPAKFPEAFFKSEDDPDEPLDAGGQVLGISAPIEWIYLKPT